MTEVNCLIDFIFCTLTCYCIEIHHLKVHSSTISKLYTSVSNIDKSNRKFVRTKSCFEWYRNNIYMMNNNILFQNILLAAVCRYMMSGNKSQILSCLIILLLVVTLYNTKYFKHYYIWYYRLIQLTLYSIDTHF